MPGLSSGVQCRDGWEHAAKVGPLQVEIAALRAEAVKLEKLGIAMADAILAVRMRGDRSSWDEGRDCPVKLPRGDRMTAPLSDRCHAT